ncbi:deoxynucleotidyltransferase terminal-interacting protein 2 isoform X1 [Micropterus dolomieu]|uniref:deoxynucleotidyltransferase terminal-interacting protein 2 isoform X1 n=1 Tax=Micropterus dolomieu TaxID=147949 RepID=UPI001E8DE72A|nr:deoxynucleotidyltransferase terminal-interacting protein 2 isoform X1 [Micropterus dolomieu]
MKPVTCPLAGACSCSNFTWTPSVFLKATPSGRRTRRTAKQAESPTQHALVETSSQLEKSLPASPPTSSMKRCTRASRLHSPEQPCTPVGSTHEGDISDLESCCSAVSDIEPPMTRTKGRRRKPRTVSQEDVDMSEVESCSSAISASKAGQSSRRSTRRKAVPESSDPTHARGVEVDLVLDRESCSSVVSESQRVTRSQRKTARTRSSTKQQTEDSELSDADSCASSVSEAGASTTRRSTRSRKQTGPIPIHLDEASESSLSPTPSSRRSRAARAVAAAAVDVSEPLSCDSEGFESGPTYSRMTRRRGKTQSTGHKAVDSDSELTDMHSLIGSPCSTRSRGTPCSSRTGSGNSSRGDPVSRRSVKELSIVLEKAVEPAEVDTSLDNSRLESTVIDEDADCTLVEEEKSQTLEEKEGLSSADLISNERDTVRVERGLTAILGEMSSLVSDSPGCAEEAVSKLAVTVRHQQEEPCAGNKGHRDTSEMEMMQETIAPSESSKPCQSVTVLCEMSSEITEENEEAMEVAQVDTRTSQGHEAVDAVVEPRPSEEEKMEVSSLNGDAQQVVELHVESVQVTSNQPHKITVESGPERQPKDVIVQNTKTISLLETSEDEDESADEEERDVSGEEEEDLGYSAEERAGPSSKSGAAGTSVEGLFMIDTRPGEDADEHYYKEKPTEEEEKATGDERAEQEEQDEEFVDEEGDDDDDEDANILFSSRNPLLKEMSSRIDPGIRLKELGGLYINFDGSKSKPVSSSLQKLKEKKIQDEVMKKSVIGPDFEKKDAVPPYSESKQALKLKHRAEKEKSTGDGWFNMKAPEISQELKGDLKVLKMRGSMDPKRFYKKNDRDGFPKYFQVGTVVDSAVDFYHSRIPNKDRKRTMVEELLADAEFRHNNKKKYQHIVTEKAAQGAGKRNKKKKFHKK